MHKLPVGITDFAKLVSSDNDYIFVDKTLFIKEFFDGGAETDVIVRPRRHLKTSTLSMVRYFCSENVLGMPTNGLFDSLAISKVNGGRYMKFQGQYPTIYLSLKDINRSNLEDIKGPVRILIASCYKDHAEVLSKSERLTSHEKKTFNDILTNAASDDYVNVSLKLLSEYLYIHHGKKVVVLIDDYDAPINSVSTEDRDGISEFIYNLLGSCLKDNIYLEKSIVMGILRIAKADNFSDLNNLSENSLLDNTYESFFSFTEIEVFDLFHRHGLDYNINTLKYWYNGYHQGNSVFYNAWSVINCIHKKRLGNYWLDSYKHELINSLFDQSDTEIKIIICKLIQGEKVLVPFEEYIIFRDLKSGNLRVLWGLLFHNGYLTIDSIAESCTNNDSMYVRIPNHEIKRLYITYCTKWLQEAHLGIDFNQFIDSLIVGERKNIEQELEHFFMASSNYLNIGRNNPEKVYHAILLGLVADLHNSYMIKSNGESGTGRYDLLLIPKNKNALGVIMEFKILDHKSNESVLHTEAERALSQIQRHPYVTELDQNDIPNKLFVVIVICGKKATVKSFSILNPSFDGIQQLREHQESKYLGKWCTALKLSQSAIELNKNIQSTALPNLGANLKRKFNVSDMKE